MNIVELAKEVEKAYKELKKHDNWENTKGFGSKAYALRRIDLLQDELMEIKKDIRNY